MTKIKKKGKIQITKIRSDREKEITTGLTEKKKKKL